MNRLIFDHFKKGLQIGSLLGTFVVFPLTTYRDLKNLKGLSIRRIFHKQAASLTIGIGISLAWMSISYIGWSDKPQKIHDKTYFLPSDKQQELDYITTIWGGGAFLLTLLVTRKFFYALGIMSPIITFGIAQTLLYKKKSN